VAPSAENRVGVRRTLGEKPEMTLPTALAVTKIERANSSCRRRRGGRALLWRRPRNCPRPPQRQRNPPLHRAAYGRVVLQLRGVPAVSQGRYSSRGRLSAADDLYDFDPQPWGIRRYAAEASTRIGSVLPGRPFYNLFNGSRPLSASGWLPPFN